MPDATGRFRGYPAGRRGAQPGVPRPTVEVGAALSHFSARTVEAVVDGDGGERRTWAYDTIHFQRGCSVGPDGEIVPDIDEFPDGSKWEVSIVGHANPNGVDGDNYAAFNIVSLDADGAVMETNPGRRVHFLDAGSSVGLTGAADEIGIIQVLPGGSFAISVVNYNPDSAAVLFQIGAHSIDTVGAPAPIEE